MAMDQEVISPDVLIVCNVIVWSVSFECMRVNV